MRRLEFRQRMERLCFQMIEDVSGQNFESAVKNLAIINNFIGFGRSIYEIEPINADYLSKEIVSLISDINKIRTLSISGNDDNQALDPAMSDDLNGRNVKIGSKSKSGKINMDRDKAAKPLPDNNPAMISENPAKEDIGDIGNGKPVRYDDQAIRQTAIIDIIRQSGKQVQIKEVIAGFPSISERTLRYDLQRICNQGILEKIGSGPSTYYKIRSI